MTPARYREYLADFQRLKAMGCDIHLILEQRWDDGAYTNRWVGLRIFTGLSTEAFDRRSDLNPPPVPYRYLFWRVTERNYELFAKLAGVRGEGPAPRGVPDDASELARMHIDGWGGDGHSHSWGLLSEIGGKFLAFYDAPAVLQENRHGRIAHLFGFDLDDAPGLDTALENYRLIYFFDN